MQYTAPPSWSPQSFPSTTASMLAFQAFHLAAYHFAHGTFQPIATSSARGCSELDDLLGGGPDQIISCLHAKSSLDFIHFFLLFENKLTRDETQYP